MVAKVKTFLVTYVIMGLEAIGDYLLENVFDGNYKKALSKDPYKGTSLSDIADHKDMPLSRQRLGECIRVAAETQELKSFGLESDFLTYYHKLEISRVKSPEETSETRPGSEQQGFDGTGSAGSRKKTDGESRLCRQAYGPGSHQAAWRILSNERG